MSLDGGLEIRPALARLQREREFFIDNLLVRIHFIIVMIWWTGLAPWKFEYPCPGQRLTHFLGRTYTVF